MEKEWVEAMGKREEKTINRGIIRSGTGWDFDSHFTKFLFLQKINNNFF